MSIIDRIKRIENKKREAKEYKKYLSVCENCGKKMIDNTFKHGSRIGGFYQCSCGFKIMF